MTIEPYREQPEFNLSFSPFTESLYDWVEAIAFSLTLVTLILTFIFRPVGVGGISMKNTLNKESWITSQEQYWDRVLVYDYNYTPKDGDIIVFTTKIESTPLIKRVIAVGGQTVDVDFDNHTVSVDGKVLSEPYIAEKTKTRGDVTFPATVPAGHVFVMGDNRNHSFDSRFSEIGMVDDRYILGKAFLRVFPFDKIGLLH